MTEIISSLVAGFSVGIVFGFFDLPIPAPPNFAGIAGILGILIGYLILKTWK